MKFEAMFQPVKIGNMTVPNRFVMSPMGNNFANTDGKMSERSAARRQREVPESRVCFPMIPSAILKRLF